MRNYGGHKSLLKWFAVSLLWTPLAQANGSASGTVNVVNINAQWGGFFVQLDNPTTQNYEAACPSANWAFVPISDPYYNSLLALLLSAKASGQTVTVYTIGCVAAAYGSQPRIGVVDLGIRSPGT